MSMAFLYLPKSKVTNGPMYKNVSILLSKFWKPRKKEAICPFSTLVTWSMIKELSIKPLRNDMYLAKLLKNKKDYHKYQSIKFIPMALKMILLTPFRNTINIPLKINIDMTMTLKFKEVWMFIQLAMKNVNQIVSKITIKSILQLFTKWENRQEENNWNRKRNQEKN